MKTIILLISAFFFLGSSTHAMRTNFSPKIEKPVVIVALYKMRLSLSNDEFLWLLHQLNIKPCSSGKFNLDDDAIERAKQALNSILLQHQYFEAETQLLFRAMDGQSPKSLLHIALDVSVASEVQYVAERTLRKKFIVPLLASENYDELNKIAADFEEIGSASPEFASQVCFRLFRPLRSPYKVQCGAPESNENKDPSLLAYCRGCKPTVRLVDHWKDFIRLDNRRYLAITSYIEAHSPQAPSHCRLLTLENKIVTTREKREFKTWGRALEESHRTVRLFEGLAMEPRKNPALLRSINAIESINQALRTSGSSRFPLGGDFLIQALSMGFRRDPSAIKIAEASDISDSQHRLYKGGDDRFIRSNAIISLDRDSHANAGYKLFLQHRSSWRYVDTVIPVRINGEWMLLLLDRNKKFDENYWYLLGPNNDWFCIRRDGNNERLEPVKSPVLKYPQNA